MHGFFGDFRTWKDAQTHAGSYDHPSILARTEAAMKKIVNGCAVFERDSVLLTKAEYPWSLITALLHTAQKEQGTISVLDFGGALGSSYYQCRPFLDGILKLTWSVVEQKHYIESGRNGFEAGPLKFYFTAAEAYCAQAPNFLLLSSVLPYLSDPWFVLDELLKLKISNVVIDRTPILQRDWDRLTVQKVPIFDNSLPAWFFGRTRLLRTCYEHGYKQRAEWPCLDELSLEGEKVQCVGLWLENTN
jgi:putative methyltransferase (TIGR04325 family)